MENLKERRERAKLTQTELAERVGVSMSQIWRIENGESGTRKPVLDAIDRVLAEAEAAAAEPPPTAAAPCP